MSSTTSTRDRPSPLIQELLFAGLFLWIAVVTGTWLVRSGSQNTYPLLALVAIVSGVFALLLVRSVVRRWRGGERVALTHSGPVVAVIELLIGVSTTSSAVSMAGHDTGFNAVVGVIGVGLVVAGVLDLAYWLRSRQRPM